MRSVQRCAGESLDHPEMPYDVRSAIIGIGITFKVVKVRVLCRRVLQPAVGTMQRLGELSGELVATAR